MVTNPIIITGIGAVGCPVKTLIKSGKAKNPDNAKNRNDNLFKTLTSLNDSEPYIREITPSTNKPITKANCSKIINASGDGSEPKASEVSIILNSGENNEI